MVRRTEKASQLVWFVRDVYNIQVSRTRRLVTFAVTFSYNHVTHLAIFTPQLFSNNARFYS